MSNLRSQQYSRKLPGSADPRLKEKVLATVRAIEKINRRVAPLLTLNHLAISAHVPWVLVRSWVSRRTRDPYHTYRIPKNHTKRRWKGSAADYRTICHPSCGLMRLQRFLVQSVLRHAPPHRASTAFSPGSSIVNAAKPHLGCRWLIKIDVAGFFESINEIAVYRVFRSLGYQPLMSFELTRLCTRSAGKPMAILQVKRWKVQGSNRGIDEYAAHTERDLSRSNFARVGFSVARKDKNIWEAITNGFDCIEEDLQNFLDDEARAAKTFSRMGYLPQGAPTSPMLANLAMRQMDEELEDLSHTFDLTYTRYADDMAFSSPNSDCLDREKANIFVRKVYQVLGKWGLRPNLSKTKIRGPGARKVILGMLVDGTKLRLPKEYHDKLRMHFYYINKVGPVEHAKARRFASAFQLRKHIEGLIHHVRHVDPERGKRWMEIHNSVAWPV